MRGADRTDLPTTMDDERTMLVTYLQYTRDTALAKAGGLTDEQAHARVLPTSPAMSVAGVLTHLRWVEWSWIHEDMLGEEWIGPASEPGSNEGTFRVADTMSLAEAMADYASATAELDGLVAGLDLDRLAVTQVDGRPITLRWVLMHLIEETARHNGHLDIMRELLDGARGM